VSTRDGLVHQLLAHSSGDVVGPDILGLMSIDPLLPYGPLIESTVRVVTWNVWGQSGPWEQRFEHITAELVALDADIVCLQEIWQTDDHDMVATLADALGLHVTLALEVFELFAPGLRSGIAILSRWPIDGRADHRTEAIDGGNGALFAHASINGPRGALDVFGVMLDYRPDHSHLRQHQVRELATFVNEHRGRARPVIVAGDFNADPTSDEMRMLTGLAPVAAPRFVFYDAWEVAGDGSAGHTWSNANPWAAAALLPSRRIDYILAAWPKRGGAGHPLTCRLIGTTGDPLPSDHFGLVADLRY
jgi:endonuclease/exonuclease/phosphatase family metal-dependent hydrolase